MNSLLLPTKQSQYWLYSIIFAFVFPQVIFALPVVPSSIKVLSIPLLAILVPALVISICDKYKMYSFAPAIITFVIVLASMLFSYFFFMGHHIYYYSFVAHELFPSALWHGFDDLGFHFFNNLFNDQKKMIGIVVYWLGLFSFPFIPKLLPRKVLPFVLCCFALFILVSVIGFGSARVYY